MKVRIVRRIHCSYVDVRFYAGSRLAIRFTEYPDEIRHSVPVDRLLESADVVEYITKDRRRLNHD